MAPMIPSEALEDELKVPPKKLHGRAFYESIGSPKVVLAPMVAQSEFAWRVLTRSFMEPSNTGVMLAYTPMFHARLWNQTKAFREQHFRPVRPTSAYGSTKADENAAEEPWLDGRADVDRPLTVQFCANDPDELLAAAKHVQSHCDAVDLNLGCPQGIARRGKYGSFLQEDQELIYKLINKLHLHLDIPVTAKIRILDTREATLAYAKNVLDAGASILTVHGRRREQKGHNTGLADWAMIRYLRENLPSDTVIFANGNILRHADLAQCLEATGADAVMSAEGNLHDPTIFAPRPKTPPADGTYWQSNISSKGGFRVDYVFREYMSIIYRYVLGEAPPTRVPLYDPQTPGADPPLVTNPFALDGVSADGSMPKKKKTSKRGADLSPSLTAMQSHLFSLLRPLVAANTEVRDALAKSHGGNMAAFEYVLALTEQAVRRGLDDYARDPAKYEEPHADTTSDGNSLAQDVADHESSLKALRACKMPWWVCQSYVRLLPKEAFEKGSMQPSKKQRTESQLAHGDVRPLSAIDTGGNGATQVPLPASAGTVIKDTSETRDNRSGQHQSLADKELPDPATVCG